MDRIVIDTSILVSAILGQQGGAARSVLRLALEGKVMPILGNALFLEYEDVLARESLYKKTPISMAERETLVEALLGVCEWVPIYYLWRPNLPDESDNHLVELAIAGGAVTIVTDNKKHVDRGELLFPNLTVQTAREFLTDWRNS